MLPGPPDSKMNYPAYRAFEITPGPNDLPHVTRAIYISGAGDVRVLTIGDDDVTFAALAVGVIHWVRVKRVMATGTTAPGIIGLY